jgi:hypothetical protein
VKFDRQIVAIARTEGAQVIYSDDADLRRFARAAGIDVVGIADLPLPPESAQHGMPLDVPSGRSDGGRPD